MNTLLLILIGLIVVGLCIHITRNACKESYDYKSHLPKSQVQPFNVPIADSSPSIDDCMEESTTARVDCMNGEYGKPEQGKSLASFCDEIQQNAYDNCLMEPPSESWLF